LPEGVNDLEAFARGWGKEHETRQPFSNNLRRSLKMKEKSKKRQLDLYPIN
jgi:hypothetical protein